jgi:putative transposase
MTRIARVVAVGLPHHITQRGNYKQPVFRNSYDRKLYLSWIEEYSNKYSLKILAFCLMINHVHFIAIPERENALAKVFNITHMRYSQYFNRTKNLTGHLWQGRFYSCVLDEPHFIASIRYVERNPVRANLVKNPWEWSWSSASSHINQQAKSLIKLYDVSKLINFTDDSWREYICSEDNPKIIDNIRKHSLTGVPLGK